MNTRARLSWFELARHLAADLDAFAAHTSAHKTRRGRARERLSALFTPSGSCVALFRLAHGLHARGALGRALAQLPSWLNLILFRAHLAPASRIGPGLYIPHPACVHIAVVAGARLRVYAGAWIGPGREAAADDAARAFPVFGDDVLVGAKAAVRGGARIGDRVRVAYDCVLDAKSSECPFGDVGVMPAPFRNYVIGRSRSP